MHLHRLRSALFILVLAPVAIGCGDAGGDDGDDSGGETDNATGSTGSADTNTTPGQTTDPPSTTGESATGEASGDTTGGGATDSGGATDTGAATGDGATDTGSMGACADAAMMDCEADEACVWVGNPNSGACYPAGPEACPDIMEMQPCQQHPDCEWSNQEGTCGAPM